MNEDSVKHLYVNTAKYEPIKSSSYIETPKKPNTKIHPTDGKDGNSKRLQARYRDIHSFIHSFIPTYLPKLVFQTLKALQGHW